MDSDECEATEPSPTDNAAWLAPAAAATRLRDMLDRYFDAVWCALRRLGVSDAELDDCAQEVFLISSRKMGSIERGHERAFLLGIAVRVASHARRTQRRRREIPVPDDEQAMEQRIEPGLRPDEIIEQKRRRMLLDEVLSAMPDDLRTVLVLFELEEMSMQQMATLLELPPGTVASRLRRAREMFSQMGARKMGAGRGGRP